jgi:Uma2 family endonuclease
MHQLAGRLPQVGINPDEILFSQISLSMIQARPQKLTFEEFLEWKPDTALYELHDGVVIEMQPAGEREEIAGFLAVQVTLEFNRLKLPYFIPKQALVRAPDRESGYSPDVLVHNQNALKDEPLWKKFSTATKGTSVPLAIEVVSSNWRDDYSTKLRDYEEIGISEC